MQVITRFKHYKQDGSNQTTHNKSKNKRVHKTTSNLSEQ